MNRSLILIFVLPMLVGCSVINFSANYYTLPANAEHEIQSLWAGLLKDLPFKGTYQYTLVEGRDSKRLKGIPAIAGGMVILPRDYVKYVYQNYYNDRFKILTTTIVHELCHTEFDLPSKPPPKHFKTDAKAISLLGNNQETITYYYQSLDVLKKYWYARKGVAGHSLNLGWNALNAASLVIGGPAYFADFYATDIDQRLNLMRKHFKVKKPRPFRRSKSPAS